MRRGVDLTHAEQRVAAASVGLLLEEAAAELLASVVRCREIIVRREGRLGGVTACERSPGRGADRAAAWERRGAATAMRPADCGARR